MTAWLHFNLSWCR